MLFQASLIAKAFKRAGRTIRSRPFFFVRPNRLERGLGGVMRSVMISATILVALVLAACGGGGGGGDSSAIDTTNPTITPSSPAEPTTTVVVTPGEDPGGTASYWNPPPAFAAMGIRVTGANQLPEGCNTWKDQCWRDAVRNGTVKFVATSAVQTGVDNRPIVFAYFRNTTDAFGVHGLWNVLAFYADNGNPIGADIFGGISEEIERVEGNPLGALMRMKATGQCFQQSFSASDKAWENNRVACP